MKALLTGSRMVCTNPPGGVCKPRCVHRVAVRARPFLDAVDKDPEGEAGAISHRLLESEGDRSTRTPTGYSPWGLAVGVATHAKGDLAVAPQKRGRPCVGKIPLSRADKESPIGLGPCIGVNYSLDLEVADTEVAKSVRWEGGISVIAEEIDRVARDIRTGIDGGSD